MHNMSTRLLCVLLLITTPCKPVSIVNGAKSLASKITNTFHKGVSSALPDVVVRWEEADRDAILTDAQQRLNQFAHTAAADFRSVAHELHSMTDQKLNETSQQLDDLINRLDTIIEGKTEHAAQQLTQIMQEFETTLQNAQNHLDATLTDINTKFYALVDYTTSNMQYITTNTVRQSGYTVTGAGTSLIGLWMLYHILCGDENAGTKAQCVSSASLIGAGFLLMDNSENLAHYGVTGYTRDAIANARAYISSLYAESS